MQNLVLRLHRSSPVEAGFDALAITERPAILTLILPSAAAAGPSAIGMIADMETCLAAAYFSS